MIADTLMSSVGGGSLSLPGPNRSESVLDQQAAMLFGADGLRSALHAQIMARRSGAELAADQPLPPKTEYSLNVPDGAGTLMDAAAAQRDTIPPPLSDEARKIADALATAGGNQRLAAETLGISRRTLVNRLNEHGLPRPKKR